MGYALALFMLGRKSSSFPRKVVFGLGLGFTLLTEIYLLFFDFSSKVHYKIIYVIFFLCLFFIVYRQRKSILAFAPSHPFARFRKAMPSVISIKSNFIPCGAALLAVMILAVLSFNLLARPTYQFDSRAIWMYKAKIIFEEHTIFSDAVLDQSRNHPHPQYPLLLPIAAAWTFANMKEPDDRVVRVLFLLFFIGLVIAMYHLQRLKSTVMVSVSASLALLVMPFIYSGVRAGPSSGYADLLLSFYITSGVLAMALWLREKDAVYLFIGSVLAAAAAMVKNEGLIFAANLVLCTVIFSYSKKLSPGGLPESDSSAYLERNVRNLILFSFNILLIGILLLPWLYVRSKLPQFLDENYLGKMSLPALILGLGRIPVIAKGFLAEFGNVRNWLIIWPLIGVAIIGWIRTRRQLPSFVLAVMVVQLLAYGAIFMITPNDLAGQMRDTLARLFFHVLPLGVTLIAYQLSRD